MEIWRKGWHWTGVITLLLSLLWTAGAASAQPLGSGDALRAAAAVNSRISYQGLLREGGQPVSGSRSMLFRLYSDPGCTACRT